MQTQLRERVKETLGTQQMHTKYEKPLCRLCKKRRSVYETTTLCCACLSIINRIYRNRRNKAKRLNTLPSIQAEQETDIV